MVHRTKWVHTLQKYNLLKIMSKSEMAMKALFALTSVLHILQAMINTCKCESKL